MRLICKLRFFVFLALIIVFLSSSFHVAATESIQKKELRILTIEINPFLETKGLKATDYLNSMDHGNQSYEQSLHELTEDLHYASNGLLQCSIVDREYLNEFPQYTQEFTLSHIDKSTGRREIAGKGQRLDESTWLELFEKGWYGWWNSSNPVMGEGIDSPPFKFDYNYLIDKFNLVERKNNDEFDMVWVFGIDPISMGEVNMIGSSAFWVDGDTIIRDCSNFVICGFTFSRRDAALECIGHLAESMLNYVYEITNESYNQITEFNQRNELSTWQQFYLCKHKSPSGWNEYGVGQIHFAPNSNSDYDYSNMTPVQSTWEDWKNNYPDLTGKTTLFTGKVYESNDIPVNRAHKRWWLSLMPHASGRDEKGYSHNWWEYITTLDYVQRIETDNSFIKNSATDDNGRSILYEGDILPDLKFILSYRSGKKEAFYVRGDSDHVYIDDRRVIDILDGKVVAKGKGNATITLQYDGRKASYSFSVTDRQDEAGNSTNNGMGSTVKENTSPGNQSPAMFSDVGEYWATESIQWALNQGIIQGVGEGKFLPAKVLSEAEFVAMLCRMAEISVRPPSLDDTHWAQCYYDALIEYELPLAGGENTPHGNMEKNKVLNRGDIARIIAAKNGFNLKVEAAVRYMYENGLSNGMNPNIRAFETYGSENNLQRDEAVTFLHRVFNTGYTTFMGEKSKVSGGKMTGIKGREIYDKPIQWE